MLKLTLFFLTIFVFVGCATQDLLVEKNLTGQKGGAVEYGYALDKYRLDRRSEALARAEQYCAGPYELAKEGRREEGFMVFERLSFSCK